MMNRLIIPHHMRWKSEKVEKCQIYLKNVGNIGNVLTYEGRIVLWLALPNAIVSEGDRLK